MDTYFKVSNKIYLAIMLSIYGIAMITCFLVDYIVTDSISWSIIVFVSLLISFAITNLPWILKKHRSIITAITITVLIYLLLYVCCAYVQGNWLFSFAYPIATFFLIFSWLVFIIIKYFKINNGYRTAIIMFLAGVFTITSNPFIAFLEGEKYLIKDSFLYDGGAVNNSGNGIAFLCLMIGAVVGTILFLRTKKRNKQNIL